MRCRRRDGQRRSERRKRESGLEAPYRRRFGPPRGQVLQLVWNNSVIMNKTISKVSRYFKYTSSSIYEAFYVLSGFYRASAH